MAQLGGECCVLLDDGALCRRSVLYTCSQWHLICSSHHDAALIETASTVAPCPLCHSDLTVCSTLDLPTQYRRRDDGIFRTVGNFIHDFTATWLPELHENPNEHENDDEL